MKRMKWLAALLIAASALLVFVGPASAYMRKQTEVVENVFVGTKVACKVNEVYENNQKTSITVQNTGDVKAYIRLRIVSYWIDSSNEIVFGTSPAVSFDWNTTDWFKIGDQYYYKKPGAPGNSTAELFAKDGKIVLGTSVVEGGTERQVVEVFAEAIQGIPTDAVTSAWPVNVEANGNIKN